MRLFCLFVISIFPFLSQAAEQLSSPFLLSQGGAGGASLKEDLSYFINPAVMGFHKKTKAAFSYSLKNNNQTALISFLDRQTKLPLAVTYKRSWSDSFKNSDEDKMTVSSGFKVFSHVSIGLTVEKILKKSLWNGGLGSVFKVGRQTSLALYLNQILKQEGKNKRALSLAIYHNWKSYFSSKIDISRTAHQRWVFRGGLESFFQQFFSVRIGGTWLQKTKKGIISGGLAFHSPKLFLEYSVEKDETTYQHAGVLVIRF